MVDGVRPEIGSRLQKHVRDAELQSSARRLSAAAERSTSWNSRDGQRWDRPSNRPMSTPPKPSMPISRRRLLVRQKRKGEIGAGQFEIHDKSSGSVTLEVSHSAAAR